MRGHPPETPDPGADEALSMSAVVADLAELVSGDTRRSRRFLGGVVAGALIGAAVAGSALLRRSPARRREDSTR